MNESRRRKRISEAVAMLAVTLQQYEAAQIWMDGPTLRVVLPGTLDVAGELVGTYTRDASFRDVLDDLDAEVGANGTSDG